MKTVNKIKIVKVDKKSEVINEVKEIKQNIERRYLYLLVKWNFLI